ncbi:MAG: hypothetical protein PHR21_06730 [Oscillospiraceae bacterium]|nr:hypothetical protein [Oscillospiraceae bacterium]
MKKRAKQVLTLLTASAVMASLLAGCSGNSSGTTAAGGSSSAGDSGTDSQTTAAGPDDTSERYSFTVYYNYTGWSKTWGQDAASQYMSEKFNVDVNWTAPDSDPMAKLNIMVSSDDLPEVIVMDRGPDLNKIARGGYLQDLSQYMYEGSTYMEDVPDATRELLKIDGVLYSIPNWARKAATGGNYQWIVNTSTYEAVGSPKLETLEDLHQYALKVKEANLTSYSGQSVLPFWCTNTDNAYYAWWPFYRAMGGALPQDTYWTQDDGTFQYGLENEKVLAALKMANQWYNEGLFTAEVFTDSADQFLEKVTNARPALLWYDFSQDDTNNFRRIVREKTNAETSYEVLGSENMLPDNPMFPAADGVDVVYGDEGGTVGWNVNCITTKAENPQRIYDLFTWMLTKDGSINMMYGPEGGLWEGKDENGNPILKKAQSEFTSAELDAAGAWFWAQPAQADNVDLTKYAVNEKESAETKNWVVDIQANLCTYNEENPRMGQKFISDENTGLTDVIDPQSDLGVSRQTILDQSKAQYPKIIMAESEDEFNKLVSDLLAFAKSNNVDEITAAYQKKHDENVQIQGYSAYDPDYDVYKLNSK